MKNLINMKMGKMCIYIFFLVQREKKTEKRKYGKKTGIENEIGNFDGKKRKKGKY